jgi:hypothetical protein
MGSGTPLPCSGRYAENQMNKTGKRPTVRLCDHTYQLRHPTKGNSLLQSRALSHFDEGSKERAVGLSVQSATLLNLISIESTQRQLRLI